MITLLRMLSIVALLTLASTGTRPVHADPVTVGFRGVVFYIEEFCCFNLPETINIGDTLTGYYTYSTDAVDTDPDPNIGAYAYSEHPVGIVTYLEEYTFRTDTANVWVSLTVTNNGTFSGVVQDRYRYTSLGNTLTFGQFPTTRIQVDLGDSTATAVGDDSLPLYPPDLAEWGYFHGVTIYGDTWTIAARLFEIRAGPPTAAISATPGVPIRVTTSPNPFSGTTRIGWTAVGDEAVTLQVFDVRGRLVRTLAREATGGTAGLAWDGTDSGGRRLPSGVYFLRASTPSATTTRRLVLLR
jgi:hypothetical protein